MACLKTVVKSKSYLYSAYILKIKLQQHIVRIAQLPNHDIYKYI